MPKNIMKTKFSLSSVVNTEITEEQELLKFQKHNFNSYVHLPTDNVAYKVL